MARPYKVWGGRRNIHGTPVRIVVAAKNQKDASTLLGITTNELKRWWAVTGNEDEIAVATENPGRLMFRLQDSSDGNWHDLVYYPYTKEEIEEKEERIP